jgi:hypothetical protein
MGLGMPFLFFIFIKKKKDADAIAVLDAVLMRFLFSTFALPFGFTPWPEALGAKA